LGRTVFNKVPRKDKFSEVRTTCAKRLTYSIIEVVEESGSSAANPASMPGIRYSIAAAILAPISVALSFGPTFSWLETEITIGGLFALTATIPLALSGYLGFTQGFNWPHRVPFIATYSTLVLFPILTYMMAYLWQTLAFGLSDIWALAVPYYLRPVGLIAVGYYLGRPLGRRIRGSVAAEAPIDASRATRKDTVPAIEEGSSEPRSSQLSARQAADEGAKQADEGWSLRKTSISFVRRNCRHCGTRPYWRHSYNNFWGKVTWGVWGVDYQ
jgi:hypothetical protein